MNKKEFIYPTGTGLEKLYEEYNNFLSQYEFDFSWITDKKELKKIEKFFLDKIAENPDFFDAYFELGVLYSTGQLKGDGEKYFDKTFD